MLEAHSCDDLRPRTQESNPSIAHRMGKYRVFAQKAITGVYQGCATGARDVHYAINVKIRPSFGLSRAGCKLYSFSRKRDVRREGIRRSVDGDCS